MCLSRTSRWSIQLNCLGTCRNRWGHSTRLITAMGLSPVGRARQADAGLAAGALHLLAQEYQPMGGWQDVLL
jgi:hypothetical protein